VWLSGATTCYLVRVLACEGGCAPTRTFEKRKQLHPTLLAAPSPVLSAQIQAIQKRGARHGNSSVDDQCGVVRMQTRLHSHATLCGLISSLKTSQKASEIPEQEP
jgi:hypothetical protein